MCPFGIRLPILEPRVVIHEEFVKKLKTKKILIDVDVLAEIFKYFLSKSRMEAACLLRGTMAGEYLVIKDIHKCENSQGSRMHIEVEPIEFCKADKGDGYHVIGWVHSHPNMGVFMSGTDIETQLKSYQSFFPDAIAMVMDPFSKNGLEYAFFRVINEKAKKIDFDYLVRRNEGL
ncbi:MAG: hypothetical protein AYK22_04415 [Thermoplasmatales archaeon SG8-52-3]|nr:MAG: hypothetical protein AYK22_04415 [Thermoplasmatales archaeon SG8-52-3]